MRRPWVSGGAKGSRLRNPDHMVENLSRDGGFTLLSRQAAGPQLRSDNRLVAPDRGFHEAAPAVACRFLPRHAALLGNDPDVVIALALCLSALPARHRRGTRWDDDVRHRIGMVTGNRLVQGLAVMRTIRRYGRDLALDLPEQRRDLTSVVSGIVGQHGGDNLASIAVNGEMQLAPGPACPAVLLLIPLALAEELQPGAIDHQVHRAVRDDLRPAPSEATAAAAQRCVVGNASFLPEQPK